ncbi:GFA family protein [Halofilum ochraceum]|uniref:GFA family protein n=1 Tax=Halofilum ochraceum TaxID=1611323 RepID=UPI0008306825|nr:GFA family protein [Halofilum ochraceum]
MEREILKGSCLCGAIQFELSAAPSEIIRCHCRMCQKAHGASFASFARFRHEEFSLLAGADSLQTYRSSDVAQRTFCGHCGSSLQFMRDGRDTFGLAISALDTPLEPRPIQDYYAESRSGW